MRTKKEIIETLTTQMDKVAEKYPEVGCQFQDSKDSLEFIIEIRKNELFTANLGYAH